VTRGSVTWSSLSAFWVSRWRQTTASFIGNESRGTKRANEQFIYLLGINAEHGAPLTPAPVDSEAYPNGAEINLMRICTHDETPLGRYVVAVNGYRIIRAYITIRRRRHPCYHIYQYFTLALLPFECTRDMFGQTELDICFDLGCP
jgi:hypothetical protein